MCIRYRGNVYTEPFPISDGIFMDPLTSNDKGIFAKLLPSSDSGIFTEPLPSNDREDTQTHTHMHTDCSVI
jgi:hypothetical protein